jgi:hypothetical protein
MNTLEAELREQIRSLAEQAFHRKLISGHGDGEYRNQYQIVYKGKTRHLRLDYACNFLKTLILLDYLTEASTPVESIP